MSVDAAVQDALERLDNYSNLADDFVYNLRDISRGSFWNGFDSVVPEVTGTFAYNPTGSSLLNSVLTSQPLRPYSLGNLLNIVMPAVPSAAPSTTIAPAPTVEVPTFNDAAPQVNLPTAPTLNLPSVPQEPALNDVQLPARPAITLPTPPTLTQVEFPEKPSITIPAFTQTFPNLPELIAPTNNFSYTDTPYQDNLMDAVKALLLNDVENGGFGIDPTEEANLWNRERDRILREGVSQEQALRAQDASGLVFPPGALAARLDAARQDTFNKLSEAEREISLKRAELMRDLRQFCVEKSIGVEELLIRDFGFRQERILNASKIAADIAITYFEAQVKYQDAKIEAFRAYAEAYRAQVDALITVTNLYKTEVEAESVKAEFNKFQVDLYNAHLAGVESVVRLYQAEMQAASIAADIEKNKLAVFAERIRAFAAQVDAQNTQATFYKTQVEGELARMELYKTQVDAYDSRVRAAQTTANIHQANLQSRIDEAKLRLQAYDSEVDVYKTRVDTELSKLKAMLETNQSEMDLYRSRLQAYETAAGIEAKVDDIRIQVLKLNAERAIENARMRLDLLKQGMEQQVGAAGAGGNIFSNLVQAASGMSSAMQIKEE